MKTKLLFVSTILACSVLGQSNQLDTSKIKKDSIQNHINLEDVIIEAIRVKKDVPVAHENISSEQLNKNNLGVDLPVLLDQSTSVVTTSDAGAGVGYTGIRVRGSDATRVNVTINGVPLNDAESQGTYWVDLPDIASSTSDIQIQRGVGSSTNGAGAFGASINLNTLKSPNGTKPYGSVSSSYGSFNSFKNTVKFGTGLLDGKWAFEGRLSKISSDGYIDRAYSDLKSGYLSAGYYGEKTIVKAIMFSGAEQTYQAWYGVPVRVIDTARTYNPYDYNNEVDNYTQNHYQLHVVQKIGKYVKVNGALHYTKGNGYYEQYKGANQNSIINYYTPENLSDYGLDNVIIGGDTITQTELIRRRWLDNDFYGVVYSANFEKDKLKMTLGGAANQYVGLHYGEIKWAQYASNSQLNQHYYDDTATKNDINTYLKTTYDLNDKISVYADLQVRTYQYEFMGYDNDLNRLEQKVTQTFFNPKGGVNYAINKKQAVYGYFGVGNKEPNRNDFVNSTPNSRPLNETLNDLEIGYRYQSDKFAGSANLYNMDYTNQLIITGELNDVGAAIRRNVKKSYRRGVELSGTLKIGKFLTWSANATLSQNIIPEFHEYVDDWDTWGQVDTTYKNTSIAFSPNIIAGNTFDFQVLDHKKWGKLNVAVISKYVGSQYIDNTSSSERMLDAYLVNDFRLSYSIQTKLFKEIKWSGWVRNFTNTQYVSNAWVYRFKSSGYDPTPDDPYTNSESATGRYNMIGLFPQAGINFFTGITLSF